jgi:phosphoribosylanthranilate isomerase
MFQIKICGLTNVEDALAAVEAGADALGLNFFDESPRCITREQAGRIVDALPPDVVKVGLFVNAPAEQVRQYFDQLGLDAIQLHGDEPPRYLAELGDRPVVRAFRLDRLEPVGRYLGECRQGGFMPRMVLVDSRVEGTYGGSGQVADWQAVSGYPRDGSVPPLVLAGGLTPQNVARAIRTVRPAAVDTASGVERSPGQKDHELLAAFVRAARGALGEV